MSWQTDYAAPSFSPAEERRFAVLGHLVPLAAMVLSVGFLGFVASLILFNMYGDRGPFVRQHLWNSVKIQIVTGVFLALSGVLMLVFVGYLTWVLVLAIAAWRHVVWAIRASRGEWVHAR